MDNEEKVIYLLDEDIAEESICLSNEKSRVSSLNKKTKNPLLEWMLFVVILGLLLLILAGSFFATALMSDKSGISFVIVSIFVIVLIKNFTDIRYLGKQIGLANSQIKQLQEVNNIRKFLKSSEGSLLRDHIVNLYEIFKRDISISQDNLISLMQARLLSRTKITDFCSCLLVTLGLVGTIIGLITSAGGLEAVVESVGEDQTALLTGIRETITGMGTAFYTTLLGAVLGGIFLRLLGNLVDSNIEFLVSCIAEMTEVYILPIFRSAARAKDSHHQEVLKKTRPDNKNYKRADINA